MEGLENFEEVSFRSPGGLVFEPLSEDEEEGGECRGGSEREDTGEEVVVCEDIGEWEGTQERRRGGVREIEREDEVVCEEEVWENSEGSVSGGESEGASEVVREGVREIVRGGVREEGVVVCEEECVACELAVKQMRGGIGSTLETPPEEGGDSQGRDLQQVVGGERAAEEVGEGLGEGSGVGERLEEGLQGNLISNSDVLMQMYPELPGRCEAVASPGCPAGEEGKGGDRGGGGGVGADAAGASGAADADVAASSGAGDADMAARDPAGHASSAPRGGTAEPLPSRPPRLLAVLSVDGGGVRDAIPTQICVRLEAMLQERCGDPHVRLADFFDLFAGTGRGGLLALMLTAPHRAAGWGTSSGGLLALMLAAPHRATGQPAIRAQDTDNRAPVVGVCLRSCSLPLMGQRAGRPSGLRTKERSGGGLLALMLIAAHRATGWPAIRAQSTSGGGLLALMLTAPHRATGRPAIRAQDVEVLEQLLRHFLRQHCGAADLCLSEAVKPLLLTSYDISTARPYFFLSLRALSDSSHDFPLIQASCEGELGGEL
ncbi:unnamed protein product [Closterium sp. NIES-64]|nr:unnamed protein product [Closterium sp. NIES-64]